MNSINIIDVKQVIDKLPKECESNNKKEICSEILVRNNNNRIFPTALRVTLLPNIKGDVNGLIVDVVNLVLDNRDEPTFKRYTRGTTLSELCSHCKDAAGLERWLCGDNSSQFAFSENDLIIEGASINQLSEQNVIVAFDKADEFYQRAMSEDVDDYDAEDFELSADDMQELFDDIEDALTK